MFEYNQTILLIIIRQYTYDAMYSSMVSNRPSHIQVRIKGGAKGAAAPGPAVLRGLHCINMCLVDRWFLEGGFW